MRRFRLLEPHVEHDRSLRVIAAEAGIPFRTVQRWAGQYRKFGLVALARKERHDKGARRAVSAKLKAAIEGLALERPPLPITSIYRQIEQFATAQGEGTPNIRPSGEHRFTTLDDLSENSLARLSRDGFNPCAVVETSAGNFQAWLKHPRMFPKLLGTFAAQTLAERYDADPSAADWRRFGRLPGFTSCKPKYRKSDGLFPFVRRSIRLTRTRFRPWGSDARLPQQLKFLWDFTYLCWNLTEYDLYGGSSGPTPKGRVSSERRRPGALLTPDP
jgi:hypothetical protein